MAKVLLDILNGKNTSEVPFWFMRQAGRYLPEYRELRAEAGGFLDMAYNPERASEVTLQPIRRFGMSGAILFSDILVIPHALGQDLRFEVGEGPKLTSVQNITDIQNRLSLDNLDETLNPIYEAIKLIKLKLADENFNDQTLIGFAGSPWTVACYMVEGGGSKNFENIKKWAYQDPDSFQELIDIVVEATIYYLSQQVEAGVEVVQLFDSWAGILDQSNFEKWVIEPTTKIISGFKKIHPNTPIIGFPRQAGAMIEQYIAECDVQGIGLDYTVPLDWALEHIPDNVVIQGNLDPVQLLAGSVSMEHAANNLLEKHP